jgi:PRTRC genetic system protein C
MARIFSYEGKEYPDPDPKMSVDDVRQSMAGFFPELSNAETTEAKRGEDTIITFKKRVGTKGATDDTPRMSDSELLIAEAEAELAGLIEFRGEEEFMLTDKGIDYVLALEKTMSPKDRLMFHAFNMLIQSGVAADDEAR